MTISLTWASYALIVTVCLGIYYSVIGFMFYRPNLKTSATGSEKNMVTESELVSNSFANIKQQNLFGEEQSEGIILQNEEATFNPEAQDFADEIVAFTSSCNEEITKEKLLLSLTRIIQKYPSLKDSEQRYELNQLIAISTENYCSIHVSADELSELWKG